MECGCSVCGLTGNYCGYHRVGRDKKSLCVACAEQDIIVYRVSLEDGGGGVVFDDLDEAVDNIRALVDAAENGDKYLIAKGKTSRIKYESLDEFQGF